MDEDVSEQIEDTVPKMLILHLADCDTILLRGSPVCRQRIPIGLTTKLRDLGDLIVVSPNPRIAVPLQLLVRFIQALQLRLNGREFRRLLDRFLTNALTRHTFYPFYVFFVQRRTPNSRKRLTFVLAFFFTSRGAILSALMRAAYRRCADCLVDFLP